MNKKNETLEKETYITPDIEVVDIEIEQFLQGTGSADVTDFGAQDFGAEDW